jgi:hypothetical protein
MVGMMFSMMASSMVHMGAAGGGGGTEADVAAAAAAAGGSHAGMMLGMLGGSGMLLEGVGGYEALAAYGSGTDPHGLHQQYSQQYSGYMGAEGEGDEGGGGHRDDDDDEDGAPGEGAADGSQVTRLVDLNTYDDCHKWRK